MSARAKVALRVEEAIRAQGAREEAARADPSGHVDIDAAMELCDRFATRNGLMIHGGAAIQAAVPGAAYARGETRDTDVLCRRDARPVAINCMKDLRTVGLEATVRPAKHPGTWSVRLGRRRVMDCTGLSGPEFETLRRLSAAEQRGRPPLEGQEPIRAPSVYLKASIHFELGRPTVYVQRWRKLLPRLDALYDAFPSVEQSQQCRRKPPQKIGGPRSNAQMLAACEAACGDGVVMVGDAAARRLIEGAYTGAERTDLLTSKSDIFEVALRVARTCGQALALRAPVDADIFLPQHVGIETIDGIELARVYRSDVPVCTEQGGVRGSPDVVLYLMYGEFMKGQRAAGDVDLFVEAVNDPTREDSEEGGRSVGRRFML
jgi:hypothetical protein